MVVHSASVQNALAATLEGEGFALLDTLCEAAPLNVAVWLDGRTVAAAAVETTYGALVPAAPAREAKAQELQPRKRGDKESPHHFFLAQASPFPRTKTILMMFTCCPV